MPTRRERNARAALDRLGPARLAAIVHIAARDGLELARRMEALLQAGQSVDPLFFDGEDYGHVLRVREYGLRRLHCTLGFMAPPQFLAAEVGEWIVESNDDDTVAAVIPRGILIS